MAKRSKWTVEVDKSIRKKFWRALTPTEEELRRGTEDKECVVCVRYKDNSASDMPCRDCPFDKCKPDGCVTWRTHFASDWEWHNEHLEEGGIPKSARPLFHKFYREFRTKIEPFIVWV